MGVHFAAEETSSGKTQHIFNSLLAGIVGWLEWSVDLGLKVLWPTKTLIPA